MKQFSISHFKAFGSKDFTIDLSKTGKNNRHLLIYGANGSGKTSIQEALWYAFWRLSDKRLEKVDPFLPAEEKVQRIHEVRNRYRNKQGENDFSIEIDGVDILDKSFDASKYQVFIIRREDLWVKDTIQLETILGRCFPPGYEIRGFLSEIWQDLRDDVETNLKSIFYEDIKISIDPSIHWQCTIKDGLHGIESAKELPIDFNEAILSLITLLFVTKSIYMARNELKENIVILDDFVTSLDAGNRIAITKYILTELASKFQLIVLTHNINYYNLFLYIINNTSSYMDDWEVVNLVCIGGNHDYYNVRSYKSAKSISKQFDKPTSVCDYLYFGNMIRQSFEMKLHEFVSLSMIGGVEETKDILARMESNDVFYFCKGQSLQDLVAAIDRRINSRGKYLRLCSLQKDLKIMVDKYRVNGHSDIIAIIRDLSLYQKVVMHPMSHGHMGNTQWSEIEIRKSIDLLEQLENVINSIKNGRF